MAENDRRQTYSLAGQIRTALNEERLGAAYRPIVDLKTREVVAEEPLARIECADGTLLAAQSFIDDASQLQLLHKVHSILMKQSMERCANRTLSGTFYRQFGNLSADLLRHPKLVKDLPDVAKAQCLRCSDLLGPEKPFVIEITEHAGDPRGRLAPGSVFRGARSPHDAGTDTDQASSGLDTHLDPSRRDRTPDPKYDELTIRNNATHAIQSHGVCLEAGAYCLCDINFGQD